MMKIQFGGLYIDETVRAKRKAQLEKKANSLKSSIDFLDKNKVDLFIASSGSHFKVSAKTDREPFEKKKTISDAKSNLAILGSAIHLGMQTLKEKMIAEHAKFEESAEGTIKKLSEKLQAAQNQLKESRGEIDSPEEWARFY